MDRPQRTPTNAASTSNQFQCPNCPDSFPSPYGLGQHAKLHGSDRKYKCTGCNYACDNARTLKSHRRICLKNRAAPAVNNDTPCARVGGLTTKATVQGLKEGEEYAKAGPSKASDPSRKSTAKARQGPLGVKDVLEERTASGGGRRRVGSTAADRSSQAAAAACAAGEEAPDEVDKNEEKRQDMAVVTKRMAILDLSTSGTPARSQLSVVEEPFVVPLKSQRAAEKENATFECHVNDKEIDVKWFHDGAKIGMDGRHFKQRAGCRRRLLITNVLFEDHGEYKCTTKDDETMAQLIVDPKFVKKSGAQADDLVGR